MKTYLYVCFINTTQKMKTTFITSQEREMQSAIFTSDKSPETPGLYRTNIGTILYKGDNIWHGYNDTVIYPKYWFNN